MLTLTAFRLIIFYLFPRVLVQFIFSAIIPGLLTMSGASVTSNKDDLLLLKDCLFAEGLVPKNVVKKQSCSQEGISVGGHVKGSKMGKVF